MSVALASRTGTIGETAAMTDLTPFEVRITDADAADLHERLARTRWPDRETVDGWSQGIPLSYVQELCTHWRDSYDLAGAEARLNAVPQFTTDIDGLEIHFL